MGMVTFVLVAAGFGEETLFRGFLFQRLERLVGTTVTSKTVIVLLASAWFAAAHYPDQGWPGVEQAVVTGLVFGAIFACTGRIWMVIFAHTL